MKDEFVIDPIDRVIHETVHGYINPRTGKKGAVGMAPVINMNPSTVQNKANPREEYSEFGVKEVRNVMLSADNFSILKQLNIDCGFIAVPMPHIEYPADADLLGAHLGLIDELGEATSAMKTALEDKTLTRDEYKKVESEFHDVVEKVESLLIVLKGMAEPEDNVTSIKKVKS